MRPTMLLNALDTPGGTASRQMELIGWSRLAITHENRT